jgi:type II secretory pathway pseudopilin PulG
MIFICKKKKLKHNNHNHFTLVEMIIVITIIMILSGIIIASTKLPMFLTFDKAKKGILELFVEAQRQTSLQGKEIVVEYDAEGKEFRLNTVTSEDPLNGESLSTSSPHTQRIPDDIEIEFPDYEEETIRYRFFPDGTASGPEFTLTFNGRRMILGVSRLTGMAYSREEEK